MNAQEFNHRLAEWNRRFLPTQIGRVDRHLVANLDVILIRASIAGIVSASIVTIATLIGGMFQVPVPGRYFLVRSLIDGATPLGALLTIQCLVYSIIITVAEYATLWKGAKLISASLIVAAISMAAWGALSLPHGLWFMRGGWGPSDGFIGDNRIIAASTIAAIYAGYIIGAHYSREKIAVMAFENYIAILASRLWVVIAIACIAFWTWASSVGCR
ncbi:MAG TPA: hypothetical protein VGK19_00680 [Capsulimonadaceae bacterium]|jgi:hypothetical protein